MKISDIKDPELKALAIKRMKEQNNNRYDTFGENIGIDEAFIWDYTDEGNTFWRDINRQTIEISTPNQYEPLFNLMSKEYDLILTISEMDEIITTCLKVKELIDAS